MDSKVFTHSDVNDNLDTDMQYYIDIQYVENTQYNYYCEDTLAIK